MSSHAALTVSPRLSASTANAAAPAIATPTQIDRAIHRGMEHEFRVSLRAVASHRLLVMPINVSSYSARPRRASPRRSAAPRQVVICARIGRWSARLSVGLGLLAIAACTHALPEPVDLRPLPVRPGTGLGGVRVIVLPLSMIRHGDTFGFAEQITNPRDYLVNLNAQIERALTERAPRRYGSSPTRWCRWRAGTPGIHPTPTGWILRSSRPIAGVQG